MSRFKFPPADHPSNLLFDKEQVEVLVDLQARLRLPSLPEAKRNAALFLQEREMARGVTYLVMRCNDDIQLITFGPRGGHKVVWNFGAAR